MRRPDHARAVSETSSRNVFGESGLMYERWFSPAAVGDRTILLVAWDPHDLSDELTRDYVAYLGPLQQGVVTHDGRVIRRYYVRLARGWKLATNSH